MGQRGQAQTLGQGQDIGRHPLVRPLIAPKAGIPCPLHNKGDLVMKSPCYVCDREWIMS